MEGARIGIVGGSGYIGSALAEYLSKTYRVEVLDKYPFPREIKARSVEHQL